MGLRANKENDHERGYVYDYVTLKGQNYYQNYTELIMRIIFINSQIKIKDFKLKVCVYLIDC